MAILTDLNCESIGSWTKTSSGSSFVTEQEGYSGNYSTSGAIAFRFATSTYPSSSNYAGIKQNITISGDYEITFRLNAAESSINDPDMPNTEFKVIWDGTTVKTIDFDAESSWTLFVTNDWRVYESCDSEYSYSDEGVYKIFTVDLSAYDGQTGDLEFRLQSNYPGGGSHCDYYTTNMDYITESYGTPITGKYFLRTTGNDSNDGQFWETPWKTIDKAANTLTDGQEVQIEGGTYSAEPAANDIAPVNAGTTGIKYTVWGSASTGTNDGTGTGAVTVEKNT